MIMAASLDTRRIDGATYIYHYDQDGAATVAIHGDSRDSIVCSETFDAADWKQYISLEGTKIVFSFDSATGALVELKSERDDIKYTFRYSDGVISTILINGIPIKEFRWKATNTVSRNRLWPFLPIYLAGCNKNDYSYKIEGSHILMSERGPEGWEEIVLNTMFRSVQISDRNGTLIYDYFAKGQQWGLRQ